MTELTREERDAVTKEYFEVADKIVELLNEVRFVYPNISKQLNTLIGKYTELHMKIYS